MDEMAIIRDHTNTPGTDIIHIIRSLGLRYEETDLPDGKSGQIEFDGKNYTITVNSGEGPQRKRFTAAHELAHFLLHRDMLDDGDVLNRHTDVLFGEGAKENPPYPFSPRHEVQANRYAAELLMPSRLVREEYKKCDQVDQLARSFKVSQLAMRIRLKNLGLINDIEN